MVDRGPSTIGLLPAADAIGSAGTGWAEVVNALPGVDVHPLGRQASLGKVSDYDRGVAQPNHNREWSGQQASLEACVRTAVESWPVA